MTDGIDDLEKLLSDVRKTISDNKQFIEKLVDETLEESSGESQETAAVEEEFEEL